ncbi:ribonuclease H-like domain-containing protein [Tanacetum coccineum]
MVTVRKAGIPNPLERIKRRLVANGRSQQQGIDCDETFSPVVKPATIRTVLSLDVSRDWPIHQLDVKNAFLHGQLFWNVYMHQSPGFVADILTLDYVCLSSVSSQQTDASLFATFIAGSDISYLLLYVDDIILTASSTALLQRIITVLHGEFAMTDLGSLNYFLGISAQRSSSGLFLSQSKFAEEILKLAHMQHCNPCRTPVDTESKLGSDGDPVRDLPIPQVLQIHALYTWPRLTLILMLDWVDALVYSSVPPRVIGVFLGDNLLSWSAKRQVSLSRSCAEAMYRCIYRLLANVVADETAWIRNLILVCMPLLQ